jgi:hypothetical protein
MVALASVDAAGAAWASLVFGKPDFLRVSGADAIQIDTLQKERDLGDPLWENLALNRDIALLLLDPDSGRRCRMEGNVRRLDARGLEVAVRALHPDCPAAVARRRLRQLGEARLPVQAAHGKALRGGVGNMVRQADCVFVASREGGAVAIAHRGGAPGLVELVDDTTLHLPGSPGAARDDARVGLCFHDFAHGQLLQLSGSATPLPRQDAEARWEFRVDAWILRDTPQPMAWDDLDALPEDDTAQA